MSLNDPAEFPVPDDYAKTTRINAARYAALYKESIENPDQFWREQADRLDWMVPFTRIEDVCWDKDDLHIRWFDDGVLNASVNCVDRHLPERANDTAIIWEGDDPEVDSRISYA